MNNKKLLMMVEIAIFTALGLVLDQLTISMPQGGSVSFVMLPIILIGLRWGLKAGLATGLLIGCLQLLFGAKIYHWAQGLLDYGVAFTVVGLGVIVRKPLLKAIKSLSKTQMIIWITLAVAIGGILRLLTHTLAGVIFFAEYAGDQNVWIYSILYNGSFMIPAIVITAIGASLLFIAAPKLVQLNK